MKQKTSSITGSCSFPILILWICSVLINIKSIFADYDIDSSYALAMSYRHLTGDRMFLQMLEPHQTSAFLTDSLIYIFMKLTDNINGIILWLHLCGVILYALVTLCLFRTLKKNLDVKLVHYICIFFFTVRPKLIVFPEYTNMMIAFSTLVFICLIRYFEDQNKKRYLILSALFLCLEILSYPTCILTYLAILYILSLYSDRKLCDAIIYTAVCAVCGSIYLAYFAFSIGIDSLKISISQMIHGDASHDISKFGALLSRSYYSEFIVWSFVIVFLALIALCITVKTKKLKLFMPLTVLFFIISEISIIFYASLTGKPLPYLNICAPFFLFICLIGKKGLSQCTAREIQIYKTGSIISAASVCAVFLLSNLPLITIFWYGILAVCVSFIPIWKKEWCKNKTDASPYVNLFFILFCLLFLMHRGITAKDIGGPSSILRIRNVIRSGPATGIFSSYMPYYTTKCNIEDWHNAVSASDALLVVGGGGNVDASLYLYQPAEISHYSTICTPTYNDNLLEYWDRYPQKYPSVIAVECWYGDLHILENSWIYTWISTNYEPSYEGKYWRFYRKNED